MTRGIGRARTVRLCQMWVGQKVQALGQPRTVAIVVTGWRRAKGTV